MALYPLVRSLPAFYSQLSNFILQPPYGELREEKKSEELTLVENSCSENPLVYFVVKRGRKFLGLVPFSNKSIITHSAEPKASYKLPNSTYSSLDKWLNRVDLYNSNGKFWWFEQDFTDGSYNFRPPESVQQLVDITRPTGTRKYIFGFTSEKEANFYLDALIEKGALEHIGPRLATLDRSYDIDELEILFDGIEESASQLGYYIHLGPKRGDFQANASMLDRTLLNDDVFNRYKRWFERDEEQWNYVQHLGRAHSNHFLPDSWQPYDNYDEYNGGVLNDPTFDFCSQWENYLSLPQGELGLDEIEFWSPRIKNELPRNQVRMVRYFRAVLDLRNERRKDNSDALTRVIKSTFDPILLSDEWFEDLDRIISVDANNEGLLVNHLYDSGLMDSYVSPSIGKVQKRKAIFKQLKRSEIPIERSFLRSIIWELSDTEKIKVGNLEDIMNTLPSVESAKCLFSELNVYRKELKKDLRKVKCIANTISQKAEVDQKKIQSIQNYLEQVSPLYEFWSNKGQMLQKAKNLVDKNGDNQSQYNQDVDTFRILKNQYNETVEKIEALEKRFTESNAFFYCNRNPFLSHLKNDFKTLEREDFDGYFDFMYHLLSEKEENWIIILSCLFTIRLYVIMN